MERAAFADLVLEKLKKSRPQEAFVYDPDKFVIVRTNAKGESGLISLRNYYEEYEHASDAAAKEKVFARVAIMEKLVDSEESLDEVRVMLVPRIRPRRHYAIDVVKMAGDLGDKDAKKPDAPYYTPFAEHLGVGLAIDRPELVEYVTDPQKRFSTKPSELDEIALTNLRRMTKKPLEQVREGIYVGQWEDEYACERMLLPEVWDKVKVKGDPVVFAPGAEVVFVTGSEDEESLIVVLALVAERMSRPRGLLPFGFVRSGGTWKLFEPKGPIGEMLGHALVSHLADAYAMQKEELEAKYEGDEEAPFVPTLMAFGDKDTGELTMTVTTWTDGVRALLPRAHRVAIGKIEEADRTAVVPWEDVMATVGEMLTPVPDLYPPRWEVKSFPDADKLEKLRALAKAAGDKAPPSRAAGLPPVTEGSKSGLGLWVVILVVAIVALAYAVSR